MTIGKHAPTSTGAIQPGRSLKAASSDSSEWNHEGNEIPIRYLVIARKERVVTLVPRRTTLDYLCGKIVTHLSLEDYCDQHGLLLERCLGQRPALRDERTDLF